MWGIKECSIVMKPIGTSFSYKSRFELNEVVQFYCQFVKTYLEFEVQDTEGHVVFRALAESSKNYEICNVDGRNIGKISKVHPFSAYWTMSNGVAMARVFPERPSQILNPLALELRYVRSGKFFSQMGLVARGPESDLQRIGIPILVCGMYITYANRYWWSVA